jgi:predicted nucleic acid-binding protein
MDKVLIDTDVILDFFFDRKPFSEFASEIFNLCEEKKIKGYTTPVIICNAYYLLSKYSKHGIIIKKIRELLNIIDVLKMDKTIVIEALNSNFKDFEDALQNFSAIQNGEIKAILTRNIKDYKNSDLAVFTPEVFLKTQGL